MWLSRFLTSLLLLVMGLLRSAVAQPATDDDLKRYQSALAVIQQFADNFCKVVETKGTSSNVEISGEAKAQIGALVKKLTDLGIEGAAKYDSKEWQGPLQADLLTMTKNNQDCRLQIWRDLQDRMLAGPNSKKRDSLLLRGEQLSLSVPAVENSFSQPNKKMYVIHAAFRLDLDTNQISDPALLPSIEDPLIVLPISTKDGTKYPIIHTYDRSLSPGRIDWTMDIVFDESPQQDTVAFVVSVGAKQWPVRLQDVKWSQKLEDPKRELFVATARMNGKIEGIDWPVIRMARLLETEDSNVAVLEVNVDNRSDVDVVLNDLVLIARHPTEHDIDLGCASYDYGRSLVLNWESIVNKGTGATLFQGGVPLKVPVKIRTKGVCNNFSFQANVPISERVGKKTLNTIRLKIRDIPALSRSPIMGTPQHLDEWFFVAVAFNSDGGAVFPTQYRIATKSAATMRRP